MSLTHRLRSWAFSVDAVPASDLMDEAANEIDRLRNGALASRETVQLTDAEREAICQAVTAYDGNDDDEQCAEIAATLRGLLERTK